MKGILLIIPILGMAQAATAHPFDGKNVKNHKILVEEVIQTTNYTYLHGKENDSDQWLAVPTMDAQAGNTYYYIGGLPMKKFESKELHRTFDVVLFLNKVSDEPMDNKPAGKTVGAHRTDSVYQRKASPVTKKDIKIVAEKDVITIGELFAKKDMYAGKTVKVKGQVTKYNPAIMDKNWVHLQDGTEGNGKFDLIVTTPAEVKVDDIVTLEGVISLNKDFGYGYSFEVMMEDAKIK
jgi:hypothetical protein